MCLICLGLNENKLTSMEGYANLSEMKDSIPEAHVDEVLSKLDQLSRQEVDQLIREFSADLNSLNQELDEKLSSEDDCYWEEEDEIC